LTHSAPGHADRSEIVFPFFGRDHFAHNSDDALVNVGTSFPVAGISVFARAFETSSGIQAAGIRVAVVKSERAFVPFAADAARSEMSFLTFARKAALAVFARFLRIAVVRAHRALVDVDARVGRVLRREMAAVASALVAALFQRDAHFRETAVVLASQTSVGELTG